MRWYEGNISEAVATSKANGAVFVVYIEGKDNNSKDFTDIINNDEVSAQLEGKYFVAIKIEENSIPHQQFSEIYKNAKAPSIFFIGKTGSPLDIITELHATVDFLKKLQTILQKHGVNITAVSKSNVNFIEEEKHSTNNSDPIIQDASPSTSTNANAEDLTAEEKIERAQELINRKRLEKQAEEDVIFSVIGDIIDLFNEKR